ncbi:tRNA/rRNA methyltransferase YfiF, partial [Providencia sp. wls1919]|nr:tRNA/rRNA methyltransferase YfiF [Providencia sp. wls1919]
MVRNHGEPRGLRVICALRAALVEKSMNDEMKGKSGKVKVMYVRSDDDSD